MGIDLTPVPYYGSADLTYYGLQANGNMQIAQEYPETAATIATAARYPVDQMALIGNTNVAGKATGRQSTDAPPGYTHSFLCTVLTAYTPLASGDHGTIRHYVEGYRTARLRWGAGVAGVPIALAFWVKSTMVGTCALSIRNAVLNRCYVTHVAISSANVWEYKVVMIPYDSSGVWDRAASTGLNITWALIASANFQTTIVDAWQAASLFSTAAATNFFAMAGTTFQIAGLLILPGTTVPEAPYARYVQRPYDQELQLAHRYYEQSWNIGTVSGTVQASGPVSTVARGAVLCERVTFRAAKRVAPTVTMYNWNTGLSGIYNFSTGGNHASSPTFIGMSGYVVALGGLTDGHIFMWHWVAASRLL